MSSRPVLALVLEGEGESRESGICLVRPIRRPAPPGTIRGDLGTDRMKSGLMLRIARSLPWSKSTGSSRRIRSAVDQVSSLTRRHTAKAAIPSSRPISPNFSLVVALMPIWLGATSRTWDKEYLIDWICGAILGLWARIVRSTAFQPNTLPTWILRSPFPIFERSPCLCSPDCRRGNSVRRQGVRATEHCIGKCVDQAIGIRMPEQSSFMGNFNSAKD